MTRPTNPTTMYALALTLALAGCAARQPFEPPAEDTLEVHGAHGSVWRGEIVEVRYVTVYGGGDIHAVVRAQSSEGDSVTVLDPIAGCNGPYWGNGADLEDMTPEDGITGWSGWLHRDDPDRVQTLFYDDEHDEWITYSYRVDRAAIPPDGQREVLWPAR